MTTEPLTDEELRAALEEGRLRVVPSQVTRDAIKSMPAEEVSKALDEGRLDDLLKGKTS